MNAAIQNIFSSATVAYTHYKCQCATCCKSKKEYNPSFSVSFINIGNFYYHTFNNVLDVYTGFVLISKPGYEYQVSHLPHLADECGIFSFANIVYHELQENPPAGTEWFFKNKDLQTALVKASPEIEYLYRNCVTNCSTGVKNEFKADDSIFYLLQNLLQGISNKPQQNILSLKMRQQHLQTIETAKHFIYQNFTAAISLESIADYCNISPFHFSRLFKSITGYTPYSYLQSTRLKNAALQLQNSQSVTQAAFYSGFNSPDYFSAAFKKKYKISPQAYIQACKK